MATTPKGLYFPLRRDLFRSRSRSEIDQVATSMGLLAQSVDTKLDEYGSDGVLSVSIPTGGDFLSNPAGVLDLTKSVFTLSGIDQDTTYSLPDGAEGKIIYLIPNTGAGRVAPAVIVDNARFLGDDAVDAATVYTNAVFRPFFDTTDAVTNNVVTMIFANGAWQSSGGLWDVLE